MWIGTIMRVITRGKPTEKNPVLWLLDEMAHIGQMRVIEDAVRLCVAWACVCGSSSRASTSSRPASARTRPPCSTISARSSIFGINSYTTADEISKRIGDATIGIRSVNDSSSDSHPVGGSRHGSESGSHSTSRSVTSSDIARRLLKPEEVLTLPDDVALIFHKNMSVVAARLIKYYNAPEFRRGRCGRQRRLGLAARVMALFTLAASLFFADVAACFRPRRSSSRGGGFPGYVPQPYGVGQPLPSGGTAFPAYPLDVRSVPHNLPSGSGS